MTNVLRHSDSSSMKAADADLAHSPTMATGSIEAQITAALASNAQIDAEKIRVSVNGNEVILRGTASSLTERCHAENAAWCTPGVAAVENILTVDL